LGPPGIREDFESLYSIVCLDWPRSAMDPSETLVDGLLTVAPRLGPYYLLWEEIGPCSVWPSEPDPPPPLTGNGAGPILVIGTTGDILTPLEASRDLAAHLQQGVLLIVEANHHGAYHGLRDDARCVAQTVDRYLTSLEIPPNQSKCQPGDTQPQPPD